MIETSRRGFLKGAATAGVIIAAPALVRASSLMHLNPRLDLLAREYILMDVAFHSKANYAWIAAPGFEYHHPHNQEVLKSFHIPADDPSEPDYMKRVQLVVRDEQMFFRGDTHRLRADYWASDSRSRFCLTHIHAPKGGVLQPSKWRLGT